jgi:hypothetical protein
VAFVALVVHLVHHQSHTLTVATGATVETAVSVVDGLGLPNSLSRSSNCFAGEMDAETELEAVAEYYSIALEEAGKKQVTRYNRCSEAGRSLVTVDTVLLPELGGHTAEVDPDNLG